MSKKGVLAAIYEEIWSISMFIKCKVRLWKEKWQYREYDCGRIGKYKDIHKGQRCFIVATGPSQNVADLEKMKNEVTFSVNAGYKAYAHSDWRAKYHVITDGAKKYSDMIEEIISNSNEIVFTGMARSLKKENNQVIRFFESPANIFNMNTIRNKYFPKVFPIAKFSSDVAKYVYSGKTVVYVCIQIAAYMGFSEIYLTGVDCDYDKKIIHSEIMDGNVDEAKHDKMVLNGILMREQLNELAKILGKRNIKVYNATRGGALEAFERVNLDEVLRTKGEL